MSERKWAELAEETVNDRELQRAIRSTADGSDICLTPYVTFIDELTIFDGVIMKGQRVIVPKNMRAEMLHCGHLGIEKCKRRARDILSWPNMNNDVYDTVSRCDVWETTEGVTPKRHGACEGSKTTKMVGARKSSRPQLTSLV